MESVENKMAAAWTAAAADLGIEFRTPFVLRRGSRAIHCAGLLPHFGCQKGTVIASKEDPEDVLDIADALGYNAPGLSPYAYETYERKRFITALSDWGWFGPWKRRPPWLAPRDAVAPTTKGEAGVARRRRPR
jgi:hypothetical protein